MAVKSDDGRYMSITIGQGSLVTTVSLAEHLFRLRREI